VIEESLESDDWNKVVDLVMKWVVKFAEMDRSQQVGLLMVMSVLGVRNCLLEIEGWRHSRSTGRRCRGERWMWSGSW
jgi:hypothetical protein